MENHRTGEASEADTSTSSVRSIQDILKFNSPAPSDLARLFSRNPGAPPSGLKQCTTVTKGKSEPMSV